MRTFKTMAIVVLTFLSGVFFGAAFEAIRETPRAHTADTGFYMHQEKDDSGYAVIGPDSELPLYMAFDAEQALEARRKCRLVCQLLYDAAKTKSDGQ